MATVVPWLVDQKPVAFEGDLLMKALEDARDACGGELLHPVGQIGHAERPQPLPDRFDRDLPVAAQLAHDRGQVGGGVVIQGAQHGRERQGPGRTLPIRPRPNRWRFGRDALESASSQPDCRPANPRGSEGYPVTVNLPMARPLHRRRPPDPGRSKRKVLTQAAPMSSAWIRHFGVYSW
jgi:hypothetical protein